jgi:hypothetical protein
MNKPRQQTRAEFMRDAVMSASFLSRDDRKAYLIAMQKEANKLPTPRL